jgi:hypothetical protein
MVAPIATINLHLISPGHSTFLLANGSTISFVVEKSFRKRKKDRWRHCPAGKEPGAMLSRNNFASLPRQGIWVYFQADTSTV